MPFKSQLQRKFFNANRGKLEAQGVDVDEWNQASKGMNLPTRIGKPSTDLKRPSNFHVATPKTDVKVKRMRMGFKRS